MGPHLDAALPARVEQPLEVGIDDVQVNEQLRRIEGFQGLADDG